MKENRAFWKSQSSDAKGMCLNKDASKFDDIERMEVLRYLPEINNKKILEIGAGIGRFTGFFASAASKVVAIDFIEKFIKENKKLHSSHPNITFLTQNVMELEFKVESFDLIFMNWMLMYLSDEDTRIFAEKMHKWLKLQGQIFLRESCTCASIPDKPMPHTHYRDPSFYLTIFKELTIHSQGNIKLYEEKYGNSNQKWWLFNK